LKFSRVFEFVVQNIIQLSAAVIVLTEKKLGDDAKNNTAVVSAGSN